MFVSRAYFLVRGNAQMLIELDKTAMEREIVAFRPPPMAVIDTVTFFYRSLFSSVMIGLENIPMDLVRAGK